MVRRVEVVHRRSATIAGSPAGGARAIPLGFANIIVAIAVQAGYGLKRLFTIRADGADDLRRRQKLSASLREEELDDYFRNGRVRAKVR
jgi:hypothetical protein